MKISYLINQYPKVSHSFIRREIVALERLGFDVQRISLRGWDDELPDVLDQQERERTRYVLKGGASGLLIPVLTTFMKLPIRFLEALRLTLKMAAKSDRTVIHHLAYLAEACRILPWLLGFGARRIHSHFGTNATDVAVLVGVLGRIPFSFTVHGPEEFMRPVGLREKIKRSAFVVGVSSFGRSQLSLWAPYADWEKIHVVHCGLERSFYEDAPECVPARTRLICVGRLVAEKGQFLLVEAAARLAARGFQFQIVFAGDGPIRPQLEELIENFGLRQHVHITGWISSAQVREEILRSRALVLPSFAEGLPVVIMEALVLRRPVITTFIAGIPELVSHGETGWLIPASSLDDLTRVLEECLTMRDDEILQMGERGRARAIERHAIEGQAAVLATLFRAHDSRDVDG